MKNKNGITLIALIITVIILLILAGVAISISVNGGDLFGRASQARENWNISVENENTAIKGVLDILNEIDTTPTSAENLISKELTTNGGNGYVGYYADFDGIPGVDGIIYVDLLVQKPASGQWNNSQGAYTIPTNVTESNVKNYIISDTPVTDARFEKEGADPSTYTARYVISPANNNSGTEARFYVMGLDNLKYETYSTLYFFQEYYGKISNENVEATSTDFGKGKDNTSLILAMLEPYTLNDRDMWNQVKAKQQEYSGWFVPSAGEWAAFSKAFNITSSDYTNYKLGDYHWASSLSGISGAWCVKYSKGYIGPGNAFSENHYVRLSAIF